MDAMESRGKRKNKCLPCLLLCLTLLRQTDTMSDRTLSCSDSEYKNGDIGVCCDKCPPGYKLIKKCTGEGLRSQCEKCSNGTFQEKNNYFENCFRCNKCKNKNTVVISSCTHLKDTECGCRKGFYKKEINHDTWSCVPCRQCGNGEMQITECAGKKDTVCTCKHSHFRLNNKTCALCRNCRLECEHLCADPPFPSSVPSASDSTILIILSIVSVLSFAVAVGVVGRGALKKCRKRRSEAESSSSWPQSPDPKHEQSIPPDQTPTVDESPLLTTHDVTIKDLVLPDCVPKEIKSHDFIYFVLDVVPINRFKELARRLNISEQDIERAEHDNRAFIDAQYQMLKVWSDRGPGGGRSILPQSLVHECVSRLKDMNLNGSAESVENKYCTENSYSVEIKYCTENSYSIENMYYE